MGIFVMHVLKKKKVETTHPCDENNMVYQFYTTHDSIQAPQKPLSTIGKIISMFELFEAIIEKPIFLLIHYYWSRSSCIDILIEFLSFLNRSGLPPHKLDLKIGAPIILTRKLNALKLWNGIRLRGLSLKKRVSKWMSLCCIQWFTSGLL